MAIVKNPAQTKTVAMGRRWGKTYMAGIYALTAADLGGAVAWVVPTYRNARAPWRFAEMVLAPVMRRVRINRTDKIIEFPSRGRLMVYSADNDIAIRGESFDVVIVDEAAMIREETYTDVIMPTVADRDGKLLLISTPKGRNWFYREWQRGNQNGYSASWTAPSIANPMPTIRKAAEMAKERVSERTYRQEWLAEFIDDAGGVFRRINDAIHSESISNAQPGRDYVMGVDWGKSNDYTVLTIIDTATNYVVHIDRFNMIDYTVQLGRLQSLFERFQPYAIIAESNSIGTPLIEQMQRAGLPVRPFNTNNASKAMIIDALALAFERGDIAIPNDSTLIAELQSYEMERLSSGMLRYSAPSGMHDDCVMSLALAWHGVQKATGSLLLFGA